MFVSLGCCQCNNESGTSIKDLGRALNNFMKPKSPTLSRANSVTKSPQTSPRSSPRSSPRMSPRDVKPPPPPVPERNYGKKASQTLLFDLPPAPEVRAAEPEMSLIEFEERPALIVFDEPLLRFDEPVVSTSPSGGDSSDLLKFV